MKKIPEGDEPSQQLHFNALETWDKFTIQADRMRGPAPIEKIDFIACDDIKPQNSPLKWVKLGW
jgi:hypothetical protein